MTKNGYLQAPKEKHWNQACRNLDKLEKVTKELNDRERRIKNINDELNSIKMFQKHNNSNFVSVMHPILKALFSVTYEGKDGSQNLQRDLRYMKIATNEQVPKVQSLEHIRNLIKKGKSRVSSTVTDGDFDTTPKKMLDQNTENKSSPNYASPPISLTQQQPLNFQLGHCSPYYPIASPTTPYQYVVYPFHWNVYGNSYMYPTNPVASSTAPECTTEIPPYPLDPPPENPPLPKDMNIRP